MRLDAHLHVWDRSLGAHDWIGPHLKGIDDDFPPDRARPLLRAAGVSGAVLVQSADGARETTYLLEAAAAHDWVRGVVGWVDLERPGDLEATLDSYGGRERLCGVRTLVHNDPRDDVLGIPSVRRTAGALSAYGLPLDVPDAFPRQLRGAIALADAEEDLVLVLDHLGKPPRGTDRMHAWAAQVRELASRPRVVAKVSGLQTVTAPFAAEALREVWEIAVEAFGPSRLMFGSDWPMTIDGPGYAATVHTVAELIGELSDSEQDWVWWRTAAATYGLDVTHEVRN